MILKRFTLPFVTLATILICGSASAEIKLPNLSSKLRIIQGTITPVKSVPVAKIIGRDSEGSYLCSGVLISPTVVLTASHCIADKASDMSVYIRGSYRSVSKFRIHPNAHESSSTGFIYNDVALLYLRRSVSGAYYSILNTHKSTPGDVMMIYGYGVDENERQGTLKQGTMVVDSVTNAFVFANYDGSTSNTCSGDSGGPAIVSYLDGEGQTRTGVVGITSGGENADCSVGDHSYFANIQNTSTMRFLKRNVENLSIQ